MVTPNTLLSRSRGFVCKATTADSTRLAPPAVVSVATTVRITLPAATVTVSAHAGKKHCSSWRKLALTAAAFAPYSSTPPPAISTRVTSLAGVVVAASSAAVVARILRKAAPLGALRVPQSIWSEPNGQRPEVAAPVLGSGPPSSQTLSP
eukprot:scaffold48543_cov43-Phaeocystis_antarctica.AAC.1